MFIFFFEGNYAPCDKLDKFERHCLQKPQFPHRKPLFHLNATNFFYFSFKRKMMIEVFEYLFYSGNVFSSIKNSSSSKNPKA